MKPKLRARIDRACRSLLKTNKVCIVNLNEPYLFQTLFHHGNRKMISATENMAHALLDIPHRWTLYLAVFCDSGREKYTRAVEISPNGVYKAARLTEVIEKYHVDLVKDQNPNHVKSSAWIAFPYDIEFSEDSADALFDSAIDKSKDYVNQAG